MATESSKNTHFMRPKLAKELARALMGMTPFSDAPNGLFLAAPRRVGKSAFLQRDLRPALHELGVVVVYLDLWVNKDKDPAAVIAQAIGAELSRHLGLVSRAAMHMGLESVSVAGVMKINTQNLGLPDGLTLADALKLLSDKSGKPVALIIDEAQHALTSKAGESAMMALKSARDTINNSSPHKLMLVMSGSDRDKLMRLVNTGTSAFYGSHIQKMPPLDENYIRDVAQQIGAAYPEKAPVDEVKLNQAFLCFGSRPQLLTSAIGQALNPLEYPGVVLEDAILLIANAQVQADQAQMESDYIGLRDVEQVVIWRMLAVGEKFKPYDGDALHFYAKQLGWAVTAQQVQSALISLRAREPSMIWKSERGDYSVENTLMREWYQSRMQANAWPPVQADISAQDQEDADQPTPP